MANDLWSSLLKESSKRFKYPDATCILLGDVDCGKTKLVENLCSSSNSKDKLQSSTSDSNVKEILSYSFFEVDESMATAETPSRIGVWSINDKCFDQALHTAVRPSKSKSEKV